MPAEPTWTLVLPALGHRDPSQLVVLSAELGAARRAIRPGPRHEIAEIVRWRRDHQPGGPERRLGLHQLRRGTRHRPADRGGRGQEGLRGSAPPRCPRSTPTSSRPTRGPGRPTTCSRSWSRCSTGWSSHTGIRARARDPTGGGFDDLGTLDFSSRVHEHPTLDSQDPARTGDPRRPGRGEVDPRIQARRDLVAQEGQARRRRRLVAAAALVVAVVALAFWAVTHSAVAGRRPQGRRHWNRPRDPLDTVVAVAGIRDGQHLLRRRSRTPPVRGCWPCRGSTPMPGSSVTRGSGVAPPGYG